MANNNIWRVELALLWNDYTWSTEVFDVPYNEKKTDLENLNLFFGEHIATQPIYSGVVTFAVYNDAPEDDEVEVRR